MDAAVLSCHFCRTERHAAELAWRYLVGQITEGHRIVKTATVANVEANQ